MNLALALGSSAGILTEDDPWWSPEPVLSVVQKDAGTPSSEFARRWSEAWRQLCEDPEGLSAAAASFAAVSPEPAVALMQLHGDDRAFVISLWPSLRSWWLSQDGMRSQLQQKYMRNPQVTEAIAREMRRRQRRSLVKGVSVRIILLYPSTPHIHPVRPGIVIVGSHWLDQLPDTQGLRKVLDKAVL